MRIRALVSYDGTDYGGWQIQPNAVTVQQKIETALAIATRHSARVIGAGRTDAGVHATGQVFHCDLNIAALAPLKRQLNGLLPPQIRILDLQEALPEFHAQFSALSKTYTYTLQVDIPILPFDRLYRAQVAPFCPHTLLRAAKELIGTRDFRALSNRVKGPKSTIRTLLSIDLAPIAGGYQLIFVGTGFLYKMVRNCTGLLLEIASGRRSADSIERILKGKERSQSAAPAPARGLCLQRVDYGPDVAWKREQSGVSRLRQLAPLATV